MNKKVLALTIGLAFSGLAGLAHGAGNPAAGKTKSTPCAGCHGEDGNSFAPSFPKLAGQHASYLLRQLQAFKEGKRVNPAMQAMVAPLSDQDLEDLSAYYSEQKIASTPSEPPEADEDAENAAVNEDEEPLSGEALLALGKKVYESGNVESGLSACIACHDPSGLGNKPAGFPVLKNQHADYIYKSLKESQLGMRGSDFSKMMQMIAAKMSDQEMKAAAAYIANMK